MAALNFPNSPSTNDLHTENGLTFKWNGTIWKKVGPAYTDTTNLNVTGIGTIAGNFHVGGVLTYEDVKNVDSVGIITARSGIDVTGNSEFSGSASVSGDLDVAADIRHIGDTDTRLRFETDTISARTAGSERLRITSGGNIGIGLINPEAFNSWANRLVVGDGSSNQGITVFSTGRGTMWFTDAANTSAEGLITYQHSTNHFEFNTAGTEKLRITSDGKINTKGSASSVTAGCLSGGIHLVHANAEGTPTFTGGEVAIFQRNYNSAQSSEISIVSGTASKSTINFGDKDDVNIGMIQYENNNNALVFTTNTAERLRISGSEVEIKGDASRMLNLITTSGTGSCYLAFSDSGGQKGYIGYGSGGNEVYYIVQNENAQMQFYSNGYTRAFLNPDGKFNFDRYGDTAGKGRIEFGASGEQYIEGYDTGNAGSGSYLRFGDGGNEYLRIDSSGRLRVGNTTESADGAFDDLIVGSHSGNRGITILSTNGQQGALGFAKSGSNADGYLAYVHNSTATSSTMTLKSSGTIHFNAGTNALERFRIETSGITVYGNENNFYGGGSGTNLNGDLKIRSTGTAVYQSLKFISSDGSSQSQILGYGGGAILFHYSNTFVWAINNQGERLELTNTALSPRTSSTVLDLGTSSKPYRNIYTNDLNLSNERMGSNDVDGTWGSYTIQEGENDLFLLNRRNGKKYKFNLTEVS